MPEVVPKIVAARAAIDRAGGGVDIEVDGGVNLDTVDEVMAAGADIIVAGSAIFDGVDAPAAARRMRERLSRAGD
jgi:ribulose-phosphate 3-epimerase